LVENNSVGISLVVRTFTDLNDDLWLDELTAWEKAEKEKKDRSEKEDKEEREQEKGRKE
jgi:hypothetical protein